MTRNDMILGDFGVADIPENPLKRRARGNEIAPVVTSENNGNIVTRPIIPEPVSPELLTSVREADTKIAEFQKERQQRIAMAEVLAATMSSALRREYLEVDGNVKLCKNLGGLVNNNPIHWLKVSEIGIQSGFNVDAASLAMERLLQAFHLPGGYRLIYMISSERKLKTSGDPEIFVRIGLQATGSCDAISSMDFVNNFTKSNWPGLRFVDDTGAGESIASICNRDKRKIGLRVLTGLPSFRAKSGDGNVATVDKLIGALYGKEWAYIVIADPLDHDVVERVLSACRDLGGRAESMKSFQFTEILNESESTGVANATGSSDTTACADGKGTIRNVASATLVALPFVAMLGAACPALIPAFLAKFAATGAVLNALGSTGGILAASGLAQMIKGAPNQKTHAETITETISRTLSESGGINFTQTVVNKHAECLSELMDNIIDRFKKCEALGAWDVGAYLIAEDDVTAEIGGNVLKSLLSGDESYQEPIRILDPRASDGTYHDSSGMCGSGLSCKRCNGCDPFIALQKFENPNILPMHDGVVVKHPLGEKFETLRSFINTRELVHLVNFPFSPVSGVPVRRVATSLGIGPSQTGDVKLGVSMFRGDIHIEHKINLPSETFAKHTLVCGINGSGKTNTILGILSSLSKAEKPFLVIEPAKQEYVSWAVRRNKWLLDKHKDIIRAKQDSQWINVYIPGRRTWDGVKLDDLALNPFDFIWMNKDEPPKILEHIDRLKTIINACLPMQESLPILMEELIYSVYETPFSPIGAGDKPLCWLPKNTSARTPSFDEAIPVPTFVQMSNHLPQLIANANYAKDVRMNLHAALKTRIESFKRGWRRQLLNKDAPRNSVEDWNNLFSKPTVINLTSLTSDDDKAFLMAVILMFIYEYRQEEFELCGDSENHELKHLLVVEEAHRVLGKVHGGASPFSAAPKQKVSEMFSNMISEVRAYYQGILIADQVPSRLNEDAIKNTNLKVVHKLVAEDDRKAMATALNLWDDQERIIGDLNVGEAIVRSDLDKEAYMIKVNKNS